MTAKQLLTGARVYRHGGDLDLPPVADVLLGDGRILALGTPGTIGDAAYGVQAIDLAGHVLLPGFVNAHYHSHDVLAKGCFETIPHEQWGLIAGPIANDRSLEEIRLRTLVGAVEALRNGITTVQDFCSFMPLEDRVVDTVLDAYREAGLRVIYSITVRDRSQLATILDAAALVPPELHRIVGDRAGEAVPQLDFVERQIDRVGGRDGMIIWALSPSAPQRCSPKLLGGVSALAARRKLPVYTHVYESRSQRVFAEREFRRFGGSLIAYMESVGLLGPHVTIAHGVWPDPSEIEHLARTQTGVVLNMLSNLRLRTGVAPITAYRRLGVPLALGSDNCSCSDIHSLFPVMKMYCLMGGIMEPNLPAPIAAEALHLATVGGARTAGQADTLGSIEAGMRADLVALDLSDPAFRPLNSVARQVVYAETGRSVRHVWVDGRQTVRDGKSATVDEAKLLQEIAAVMPDVTRQLDRLRAGAASLSTIFAELHRRAWSSPLSYDRYLQRN
jgi:cytosine/adenosine deaminase-related metal-dependent hydrolase